MSIWTSTKIPNIVKKKDIPIILPANVHSIMPKLDNVTVMTITLNAMPRPGVKIMDIIPSPVLFLNILTDNVRTDSLIINNVKKTARGLVVNKGMSILVPRDGFMPHPTVARGILLTVNAVPLLPLPVVRLTTALTVMPRAVRPAWITAVIPVTVVVPIHALPDPRTIPAPWPDIPNAARLVTDVKTVLREKLIIPALMSALPNAVLVMLVPIPAGQALNPSPVLLLRIKSGFLLPNAAPVVMNANITLIVP